MISLAPPTPNFQFASNATEKVISNDRTSSNFYCFLFYHFLDLGGINLKKKPLSDLMNYKSETSFHDHFQFLFYRQTQIHIRSNKYVFQFRVFVTFPQNGCI